MIRLASLIGVGNSIIRQPAWLLDPAFGKNVLAERGDTNGHHPARIKPWINVYTVAVDELSKPFCCRNIASSPFSLPGQGIAKCLSALRYGKRVALAPPRSRRQSRWPAGCREIFTREFSGPPIRRRREASRDHHARERLRLRSRMRRAQAASLACRGCKPHDRCMRHTISSWRCQLACRRARAVSAPFAADAVSAARAVTQPSCARSVMHESAESPCHFTGMPASGSRSRVFSHLLSRRISTQRPPGSTTTGAGSCDQKGPDIRPLHAREECPDGDPLPGAVGLLQILLLPVRKCGCHRAGGRSWSEGDCAR
jgi:hypothetical protein